MCEAYDKRFKYCVFTGEACYCNGDLKDCDYNEEDCYA